MLLRAAFSVCDVAMWHMTCGVAQVAPAFLKCLQELLPLRHGSTSRRSQLHAMLDRAILKLTKIFTNVLETHPWSLLHCDVFSPLLDFMCSQIVGAPAAPLQNEGFYTQCMLFVHGVLKSPAYGGSMSSSFELNLAARSQVCIFLEFKALPYFIFCICKTRSSHPLS